MNEIRPSVYRAAMKLLSLQRLCHSQYHFVVVRLHLSRPNLDYLLTAVFLFPVDNVLIRHIMGAFHAVGGTKLQDVGMNREEVTHILNRMFHRASQEVPGHVTMAAPEEACSVIMRLFNNRQTGSVSACCLQTVLIALSADNLMDKYTSLLSVSGTGSGSISRCELRSLLQDLSQLPAAVHEEGVFGGVEAAVRSCFNGVLTPTAKEEHVLKWLQGGPRLLLWLPTLYRLSVSQKVSHAVRCHTCKTFPITGLRYRCMKCVNIHICQSCFLTNRQTRKHKNHHPVLEFCTQPTWRESLSSLVQSARHALLPQRTRTQSEADRRRVLIWAEPGETQDRAPPPSDVSTKLAASTSSDINVSHDALLCAPPPPPPSSSSSKVPQVVEEPQDQQAALLAEVRNLQRDKWLLEQQVQAWRLTVQSEHGVLEDRCSEMEVTMKTLRQHNVQLQGMLTQALSKMEAQQDARDSLRSFNSENSETSDSERNPQEEEEKEGEEGEEREEGEELMKEKHEWKKNETPSPTIHWDSTMSHDESPEVCQYQPSGQQNGPEEGRQEEDPCPSGGEDCGKCSPEDLLQETVDRLKTEMETGRWTERQTGEMKREELLEAAEQVGDRIHHLVDAARTD
ncbi:dystrotelin isoform X2 [Melanotaenia boesemani]|nr:dystrotelin isoform X2 [Melanotaenia boesemani]